MDHMQFLMVRSKDAEDAEVSGHALMATCPPQSHIDKHGMDVMYPQKMPELGMPDLLKLLDLSQRLPLDGEITPIMAWALIRGEPGFAELTQADFDVLKEDLKAKVRCYGYVLPPSQSLIRILMILDSAPCLKSSKLETLSVAFW